MPWLVSVEYIDGMIDVARERGTCSGWWRDEALLADYWDMMGFPSAPMEYGKAGVAAVGDGDFVAWIGCVADNATGGIATWTLFAIAPPDGRVWAEHDAFFRCDDKGKKLPMPENWITKWRVPAMKQNVAQPCEPGDWVACRVATDASGMLGRAVEVKPGGRPLTVAIDCHGSTVVADTVAKNWFKVMQRSEACEWFFDRGVARFPAYINMLAQLARKQKKLTGVAHKPSPKSVPPGVQERLDARQPAAPAQAALAAPDPEKTALMQGFLGMVRMGMDREAAQAWLTAEHEALAKRREQT